MVWCSVSTRFILKQAHTISEVQLEVLAGVVVAALNAKSKKNSNRKTNTKHTSRVNPTPSSDRTRMASALPLHSLLLLRKDHPCLLNGDAIPTNHCKAPSSSLQGRTAHELKLILPHLGYWRC